MASPPPSGKSKRGFCKFLDIFRSPSPSRSQQSQRVSGSAVSLSPPAGSTIATAVQRSYLISSSISNTSILKAHPADPSTQHGTSGLLDRIDQNIGPVGLKPALQALQKGASVFPPLKPAIEALISCLSGTKNKSEYETLASELKMLADFLSQHMGTSPSFQTSGSLEHIAFSIQEEANLIVNKQTRSTERRLFDAIMDEDDLVGHLRRIESLFQQLQTNVTLSMWTIAKAQSVDTRLKDLNPAKLARYDSEPSKGMTRRMCTENTRVDILKGLNDWSQDPNAADIIETTRGEFLCSRTSPECRIVGRIVPTIAYQLARYSIPYRGALYEVLENDPDIGSTNIGKQFERLLREPMMGVKTTMPENLVVVIDALDECEDRDGVQRLLDLLFQFAGPLPLKFFVTSRPEPEIYRVMISQAPNSRTVLRLHEIETSLVQADIALYLTEELGRFMMPSIDQIEQLSQRSGNLFIYAATLVRHVQLGNRLGDHQKRLDSLLAAAPRSTKQYAQLDELYATVLKSALTGDDLDDEAANDIKAVLQTVVCVQEPVDLKTLVALAGLDGMERAQSALRPLRSVLHLSENSGLVSTLHASFPDFMCSQERSGSFFCDVEAYGQVLARQCFAIMQAQLQFNICNLESSFVADKDVDNLQDRIARYISNPLFYACRYWTGHLCSCKSLEELKSLVEEFLTIRLLFWMEVMNLKGAMGIGVEMLSKAIQWLQVVEASSEVIQLIKLAEGARNLVTTFAGNAISQSTPHIYTSLLPFCPKSNRISEHYRKRTHGLIEAKGTGVDRWDTMPLANWRTGLSPIYSMAYSPNRARGQVVYGCFDGTIGIRSANDGSLLVGPVEAHDGIVRGVIFSPSETQVASCGEDRTIRLWDVRNGVAIGEPFRGHSDIVTSISFAPDGTCIVSGSDDCTIRIWDVTNGAPLASSLEGHTKGVMAVAFSPDGTRIVSGSADCTVRVWSFIDGAPVAGPFTGHTGLVRSVAFSLDSTLVVSGSDDWTVRLWAANSGAPITDPFEGHTDWVTAIAFSPDGTRIASSSKDSTIRMWDISSGTFTSTILEAHTDSVTSVAFSLDGTRIISGSTDCTIRVWTTLAPALTSSPPQGHTGWVFSVAFSPDGSRIVSGSDDHTVRLWDAQTGTSIDSPLHGHTEAVSSVAFSPDGALIASSSYDHTIRLWSVQDRTLVVKPLEGHTNWVMSVAFSPDGTRLVSGSIDKTVRVWSIPDGDLVIGPLSEHTDQVMRAMFSPDGTRIISGSCDCTIRVWNTDGTPAADPFKGHTDGITSISISSNVPLIASGSYDHTVRLWGLDDGTPTTPPLRGHTAAVYSVTFSCDGTRVISGSEDRTVRLWNSNDGTPICSPFEGHTSPVYSVAFSSDGAFAISGSDDCTIRFWNTHDIPSSHSKFESFTPSPNPVGSRHSIVNSFGWWSIQEDGWVMGSDQCLLFWLPLETVRSLLTPHCYMVIGRFGSVEVDLSAALLGNNRQDSFYNAIISQLFGGLGFGALSRADASPCCIYDLPPRHSTQLSAESQSTPRSAKSRKAPESIVMEDSESDDVQEIVPSLIAPPKVKRGRPARNKEEKGFRDGQEIEKVVQPM
ncbi:hypothetical protein CTheo_4806 [Ceratobasidium theobromae]|uniref:Nephrocystin 3-like N-terminal domain-containing protein n=1 Tax=Ceratobasidium theobromae TaxID=1582974 RepID=A0A5N5QKB9_9AGAM|nr:hypothetical protein CTheo_4806 [Ceratobasidium theobromae]